MSLYIAWWWNWMSLRALPIQFILWFYETAVTKKQPSSKDKMLCWSGHLPDFHNLLLKHLFYLPYGNIFQASIDFNFIHPLKSLTQKSFTLGSCTFYFPYILQYINISEDQVEFFPLAQPLWARSSANCNYCGIWNKQKVISVEIWLSKALNKKFTPMQEWDIALSSQWPGNMSFLELYLKGCTLTVQPAVQFAEVLAHYTLCKHKQLTSQDQDLPCLG